MQNKLNQNQIEKINERFHDHPLLVACRQAFECYDAEMQRLLFAPEEIFLEAAIILNKLLTEPEGAEQYVKGLWNVLKVKIRRWEPEAPQEDVNKISSAILYVVAAVLCQHHHHFYNDELKDMALGIAKKNISTDHDEEERVILELSRCADGLLEWFSDYCESSERLSDEILEAIANEKPKGGKLRVAKNNGEKPDNPPKPRETMTLMRKPEVTEGHLKLLFMKLAQDGWISGNEADFKALFSGKRDEDCIVTWMGKYGKSTVVELFNRFVQTGLVIIPDGYSLSSILEGHFKDQNDQWLIGLNKGDAPNKKALPLIVEYVKLLQLKPDRLLS